MRDSLPQASFKECFIYGFDGARKQPYSNLRSRAIVRDPQGVPASAENANRIAGLSIAAIGDIAGIYPGMTAANPILTLSADLN
jgi:hypothetical protein